ncbi:MAG TPA: hypothetical protein P5307_15040, partial [Pirellulaceae bacterium]|nr:hypothetical protein [Pirellulaceae bacterium]
MKRPAPLGSNSGSGSNCGRVTSTSWASARGGGPPLRDPLAARAVQQFVQRRLRGPHLPLGPAGGGAGTIDLGRGDQLLPAQGSQAREIVLRIACAGLRRCQVGAGLGDLLAARPRLQFGQHLAALLRLRTRGDQLRFGA